MKKLLTLLAVMIALFSLVVVIGCSALSHSLPEVKNDAARSSALMERVLDVTQNDAFEKVPLIRFQLDGGRTFTWDKRRQAVHVLHKDDVVIVDLSSAPGGDPAALKGSSPDAEALKEAHGWFINDLFWLHPFSSFKNEGVQVQSSADKKTLIISYASGGHTPGDKYVFLLDDNAQPTAWQMHTGILPIKGLQAAFDDWRDAKANTRISYKRPMAVSGREVTLFEAGENYSDIGIADPFVDFAKTNKKEAATSQPSAASQPNND